MVRRIVSGWRYVFPGDGLRGLGSLVTWSGLAIACAQSAQIEPYAPRLARPEAGQVVLAQAVILVADASGSMDPKQAFPRQKAVLQSFVAGMPPGTYGVAFWVLGGYERDQLPLEKFDRFELRHRVRVLEWTGRETPLAEILAFYAANLPADTEGVRFVIFSDGVPTRYGRYIGPEPTLAAAQRLLDRVGPDLCVHAIDVGSDPRGPALLQTLARLTNCGSYRTLAKLNDQAALYAFQQQIFNGPEPPPKAPRVRRIIDLDRDGVDDRFDRCARTPLGARVDERGCWVIEDTVFEINLARIRPDHTEPLDHAASVLDQNPELRVRLDGHTDDTGTAEYNFTLGTKRAEAVRNYLVSHGIARERLQLRSFGATRPISDNGNAAGRAANRRVELSILDP